MSSPFDELQDSWSERKSREKKEGNRRKRLVLRAGIALISVALGGGFGAGIHEMSLENETANFVSRVLGGLVGGLVFSWFVLWRLIGFMVGAAAERDIIGDKAEEGNPSGWLFLACLFASCVGSAFGASLGLFSKTRPNYDLLYGGVVGGLSTIALLWAIKFVRRRRRLSNR
jgi:hypothetical protein